MNKVTLQTTCIDKLHNVQVAGSTVLILIKRKQIKWFGKACS